MTPAAITAAVVAAAGTAFAVARRTLGQARTLANAIIHAPTDDTRIDERGAVRSVQCADIEVPTNVLDELWQPVNLERLARTYWAFLTQVTLGLIRVSYTPGERFVVFIRRPFVLLRFKAPEYEMNAERGIVRWRIERGILVAKRGCGGDGYLEIDVRRLPPLREGMSRINIAVEVANFYPAIAHTFSRFVYTNTQSRIHVLVTWGFLRRVAKRQLDESVTGRFAVPAVEQLPEPIPERERVATGA
jgi:hypothetical protein